MVARLSIRNLFRNRWRSLLTLAGVAVATALLTWTVCLIEGMTRLMIRGATSVELGQVQIHTVDYADQPSIYDDFEQDENLLSAVESPSSPMHDLVEAWAPRCRVFGLIGHERRSQVASITGVDPVREAQTSLLDDAIVEGRWLSATPEDYPAPREVVLGRTFAQQLEVSVGDELVVFVGAADGSLGNDLLRVVGIIHTGNTPVDRLGSYMNLADVQYIAALEGRIHEIAIKVSDYTRAPEVAAALEPVLAQASAGGEPGEALFAESWQDIVPELANSLELNDRSIWITFFIVYLVVAFGLLNTQRMSALERRREFGVLIAVGLKPGQIGRMIVVETVVLTLLGALIGAAAGLVLSVYHAKYGFDMSALSDETFSWMGVSFSERLFFVVTPEAVWQPLVAVSVVAFLCSIWPALWSARLDPPRAIAGRT